MTQIHAFILLFGIGPYRWNIVFVYMIRALFANIDRVGTVRTEMSLFYAVYVAVFRVIIPFIWIFESLYFGSISRRISDGQFSFGRQRDDDWTLRQKGADSKK